MRKGNLLIISSPSGGGKSTIISHLMQSDKNLYYSISATTRKPRNGEENGKDYFFLTRKGFKEKIKKGEFLEWAEVHNNFYGTLKSKINSALEHRKNVLLDIDVQGGISIKNIIPEAVLIFLLPPSIDELEKRLILRGTETEESLRQRLNAAKREIEEAENYDFRVINNKIENTVKEVKAIIKHYE